MVSVKIEQRFLDKIDFTDNCWIWKAAKTNAGYGMYSVKHKLVYAHRYSYALFIGELEDGKELDHLCRRRDCVNPTHLEQVTHRENVKRGLAWDKFIRHNSSKDKCPKGHNYDYIHNGKRGCKKCRGQQATNHYLKRLKV